MSNDRLWHTLVNSCYHGPDEKHFWFKVEEGESKSTLHSVAEALGKAYLYVIKGRPTRSSMTSLEQIKINRTDEWVVELSLQGLSQEDMERFQGFIEYLEELHGWDVETYDPAQVQEEGLEPLNLSEGTLDVLNRMGISTLPQLQEWWNNHDLAERAKALGLVSGGEVEVALENLPEQEPQQKANSNKERSVDELDLPDNLKQDLKNKGFEKISQIPVGEELANQLGSLHKARLVEQAVLSRLSSPSATKSSVELGGAARQLLPDKDPAITGQDLPKEEPESSPEPPKRGGFISGLFKK